MTLQALPLTAVLVVLHVLGPRVGEGAVTETTTSNRPPFSFACGMHAGSGSSTFCSATAGDKKYVQVQSVEIYRDYSNEVGKCLDPEKVYIADLLTDWFNYDCKMSNAERDEEYKKLPVELVKDAMTKHCGIANANVTKIIVNYECLRSLIDVTTRKPGPDRDGIPTIPLRTPSANGVKNSTTNPLSILYASKAPDMLTTSAGHPGDIASRSSTGKIDEAPAKPSSGSSGGVIETTAFNQPQFTFACWPKLNGGASPFCGSTGTNTYMSIDRIEIYRDHTNQVGYCLDPEKIYIKQLLNKWFNYDCKMPLEERGGDFQRMPIDMLKVAMTAHCGIAIANVYKIVAHYECVKEMHNVNGSAPGVPSNGSSN